MKNSEKFWSIVGIISMILLTIFGIPNIPTLINHPPTIITVPLVFLSIFAGIADVVFLVIGGYKAIMWFNKLLDGEIKLPEKKKKPKKVQFQTIEEFKED